MSLFKLMRIKKNLKKLYISRYEITLLLIINKIFLFEFKNYYFILHYFNKKERMIIIIII